MTEGDGRNGSSTSQTRPPTCEPVDWDDDTVPGLDVDDQSFDRVTAIPELPSELFAKQLMAAAPPSLQPDPVSGMYECKVPGPPPSPSLSPHSLAPFELEQAILAPSSSSTGRARGDLSTAPPPRRGATLAAEPAIEFDHSALGSARERWTSPPKLPPETSKGPLELDLRGLEASLPPPSDAELRALTDRFAMGDYSGALVVAEGILEGNPKHAEAERYANNCREVLTQMYSARIGSLDQLVAMAIPAEQIRWLSLDHRSGFLLSLVDGTSSIEEILDMSGMPRLDALRIMFSLFSERVVALSAR